MVNDKRKGGQKMEIEKVKKGERIFYAIDIKFILDATLEYSVADVNSLATHFALKDILLEYLHTKNPKFEVSQIIQLGEKSAEIKMLVKKII